MDREKSEFMQFASSELIKELLNALDSFDLAIRNAAAQFKDLQDTADNLPGTGSIVQASDLGAANQPHRFYRALTLP